MSRNPPPLRRITFEAALNPNGKCFSMDKDGEATLSLVVPDSTAQPLAEAMAAGWLKDTSFIVTIAMPGEDLTPPSDK